MASFFDEIARNKLKSFLLMGLFTAFFMLIIYVIVYLLIGLSGPAATLVLFLGFIIILLYATVVYFTGDRLALKMSGAQPADSTQYSSLYSIVEGIAAATQVPMPKIFIVNDPSPNAFATGRNKKVSAIAVTSGLLAMMQKRELQGVIAHEMSHISNGDMQFMMIAIIFAGAIGIIAAVIRGMFFFGGIRNGRNNEGSAILLIVALVIGVLAPIFALLIRLAISRRREYMADANGARITRDPQGLAAALTKIKGYTTAPKVAPVKNANEVNAPMYFSNPLSGANVMNLFSTHPPIDERIRRLEKMY